MQFSQTKEREDNMISTEVTKTRRRGHLAVATIAEDSMSMKIQAMGSRCSPDTQSGSKSTLQPIFFQGDMTAEEIFNMFFGGGMPGSNVYVRRGGRWHRQAGNMQEQQVNN